LFFIGGDRADPMPGKNERQGRSANIFFFHEDSLQGHIAPEAADKTLNWPVYCSQARFKGENRTYTEKAAFSNCFNLFASNSCSRRFFVIAMARWISSRASESLPIFISRSPRTLGKRW
jgi:hypothetical protein